MHRVRKIQRAETRSFKTQDQTYDDFYVIAADMAKDGSANTSVVVLRITPKDTCFMFKLVNAYKIDCTDYNVVSDELKQAIIAYDARLLIYDANGIESSPYPFFSQPRGYANFAC